MTKQENTKQIIRTRVGAFWGVGFVKNGWTHRVMGGNGSLAIVDFQSISAVAVLI